MTMITPRFAQVAVDLPFFTPLTYAIPEHLQEAVLPGQLVQVPFRNKAKTGLVMAVEAEQPEGLSVSVRELLDVVDPEALLSETGIEFLKFVAEYYLSPIGEVVRLAIPSSVRLEGIKCYARVPEPPPIDVLDEDLRGIWEFLGQQDGDDPVSIQAIKDSFPSMTFLRLGELEQRGYVTTSYVEAARVKAATERYYRVKKNPSALDRLGSKQEEILGLFDQVDAEEIPLADIREVIDSPYSSLKSLVERGFLEVDEREVYRDPFESEPVQPAAEVTLTRTQQAAVAAIAEWQNRGEFRGFVLHGVTGSGKTQVYVQLIRNALALGKRGIILLPEIALTPQFVAVFRSYFGDKIAVLHSGLTPAEKFDQWRRIRRDEVDIVIGARSAIFAPVSNLGLIIVDEEHDPSFKQGEGTRYNARDMSLVRGKLEGAQVVLGSATPSLESYFNALEGRLEYLEMPERVADRPLPEVILVDIRGRREFEASPSYLLAAPLHEAIEEGRRQHMQTILFLNRRGYTPCIICEECGHVWMCPNCDVSLTYHKHQESLRCHYCDYSLRVPETCSQCGASGPSGKGVGTQKLEEHLRHVYRGASIGRLDRDTSTGRGLMEIINKFRRGDIDLLIGTQMVTKGHDFPKVTTVGVVMADLSLNFPDFRASERTFQLLTQVAGRAGRAEHPGRVFVQSYNPEHYSLEAAQQHDFKTFAEQELRVRREVAYPPFGHLIAIKFEAISEAAAHQAARDYAFASRKHMRRDPALADAVFMLGPALAPLARLKGKTRWQILYKSRSRAAVRRLVSGTLEDVGYFETGASTHKNVRVTVDVDPLSML